MAHSRNHRLTSAYLIASFNEQVTACWWVKGRHHLPTEPKLFHRGGSLTAGLRGDAQSAPMPINPDPPPQLNMLNLQFPQRSVMLCYRGKQEFRVLIV